MKHEHTPAAHRLDAWRGVLMKRDWKAVSAAVAAASGVGFSSGRTIAMFFSQMGWASWIGVAAAAIMFGALCGGACVLARRSGAVSPSGACMRLLGMRFGRMIGALYGLLMALTGSMMLCLAGDLAALALPVKHARWIGILFAMGIAMLLNIRGMRGLAGFGAVVIVICAAFYAGHALDTRPVRFYRNFETVPELAGSVSAALVLAGLYAAMSASVSFCVVTRYAKQVDSPAGFALKCGLGMLIMLSGANAAVTSGGWRLLSLALPTVALAARWGTFGYYSCILSMFLPAAATLSACVGAMISADEKHDKIPC